jgi:hypothetical protein
VRHGVEEAFVIALVDDEIAEPLRPRALAGDDGPHASVELVEGAGIAAEDLEVVGELIVVVMGAEEVADDALG